MVYFLGAVREHRACFFERKFEKEYQGAYAKVGAQRAASEGGPYKGGWNRLGSGGADDAILEQHDQLFWIAGRRETGLAGADYGERFFSGEMR